MWICPKCGRAFKRNNQSHYCGDAPKTIEDYISQQDESIQSYLLQLHQVICNALPDIEQGIAWSMPTYSKKGIVLQFYAHKAHVSLYVGENAIEHFQPDLQQYECKKSAVYLRYAQPIPVSLMAKMAKWCYSNA